jgi:hypothetical protein
MMMRGIKCFASAGASTLLVLVLTIGTAEAGLNISLNFLAAPPEQPTAPYPGPPSDMIGGGNLRDSMKAAAESWEEIYKNVGGNWNVRIDYGWCIASTDGAYGRALLTKEARQNHGVNGVSRNYEGRVCFNPRPVTNGDNQAVSDGAHPIAIGARHPLFADPTPRDSDEYKVFTAYTDNDVRLNTGRVYSAPIDESVRNAIDLYTLAMHEIGHVLGLDAMYSQYVEQEKPGELANTFKVFVTRSRPHPGYEIPIVFGPHVCDGFNPCRFVDPDGYRTSPTVLMTLDPIPGERVLISGVDALLIAQLNLVANPSAALFWPMWPAPSPARDRADD